MIKILIAVVLIHGLKLDNAIFWYVVAVIAGGFDICVWNYADSRRLNQLIDISNHLTQTR
jgi:hypothetical protein